MPLQYRYGINFMIPYHRQKAPHQLPLACSQNCSHATALPLGVLPPSSVSAMPASLEAVLASQGVAVLSQCTRHRLQWIATHVHAFQVSQTACATTTLLWSTQSSAPSTLAETVMSMLTSARASLAKMARRAKSTLTCGHATA